MIAVAAHVELLVRHIVIAQPTLSLRAISFRASSDDQDGVVGCEFPNIVHHRSNGLIAIHLLKETLPVLPAGSLDMVQAMPNIGDRSVDVYDGVSGQLLLAHAIRDFDEK